MGSNPNVIAWLKLLRLPNIFTAVADVAMGYLVTHSDLEPTPHFMLLVAASCLLYMSGIVLNDVFDAADDARGRPERPIPSGRVSQKAAAAAGCSMMIGGILVAWIVAHVASDWRPGLVATLLAVCIVLYDVLFKRTPLAPFIMGACRALNVLLGMGLAYLSKPTADGAILMQRPWFLHEWLIAFGVGIYIAGVTIFARTDARTSSRARLVAGLAVILAGMGLLAAVPGIVPRHAIVIRHYGWLLLWAALMLITARRCTFAILEPTSQRVQAAVRHCVQSIIVIDAAVCVGYASPYWGLAVLMLLFPAIALTMWLDAT